MARSLFSDNPPPASAPLAERMRPRRLAEVAGQAHLLGEGGFLPRALAAGRIPSLLLWGPPGCGKTTLARLLAEEAGFAFHQLSAVMAGVKDVREVIEKARRLGQAGRRSLLFLDEIHRFHRGQQDALLPHVERGTIVLVGATTESPAHNVIGPLLSRCRVLELRPLEETALIGILRRAVEDPDRGLGAEPLDVSEEILEAVAREAEGDARRALTTLEIAADLARSRAKQGTEPARVERDDVLAAVQRRLIRGDRNADAHYDLASALIKSLRGSDPDAALYYLMRALECGEDPQFLLRRMIILASEDIGLADPRALEQAVAAAKGFDRVGLPEGSLLMAQAAIYLSIAPKSNAVIKARDDAARSVREGGNLAVPRELADASTGFARRHGRGEGYRYPHDEPGHHVGVDYLPEPLRGRTFYEPSDQGLEKRIQERLARLRTAVRSGGNPRKKPGPTEP